MEADSRFSNLGLDFWANVKWLSQKVGYSDRKTKTIKKIELADMVAAYMKYGYNHEGVIKNGAPTQLGEKLIEYFDYRADTINNSIQNTLMDVDEAKALYNTLAARYNPNCPQPLNKQKGDKSGHAYFTCIINMLFENELEGKGCDYDPKELTSFTHNNVPSRLLSRRVDGAYPSTIDPKAIWEIKEYYYTTTFGSRIADGVYETLLDGIELVEVRENLNRDTKHYLFVDSHRTWWGMGKSYLCRIVDLLNMGYVTEAVFGKEVVERIPHMVNSWD